MLHARWVRPGQGPWLTEGFAKPLSVDESSIKHLPNVKIVQEGDFLGVVGPVEYQVVQAAAQLKVKWAETPILPGHGNLWKSFREADSAGKMPARITTSVGNFDTAFKAAAKTVSGSFKYPYNGHTRSARPARSPTTSTLGGPDKDTRHGHLATRRTSRQHRDDLQQFARAEEPEPGAPDLLRGLELVRQRLPLPRHRRGRRRSCRERPASRCASS